jgi:hypothetical protein
MEISHSKVVKGKLKVLTVKEYIAKYLSGQTTQSVYYAINNDYIDYCKYLDRTLVVINKKAKTYTPRQPNGYRETLSL